MQTRTLVSNHITGTIAGKLVAVSDYLAITFLVVLYFFSFTASSPVNGPTELFGQDSIYIIWGLNNDLVYPFNPQNHLLFHVLAEGGYSIWRTYFDHTLVSVYQYLKLITAFFGLGFLLSLRYFLKVVGLEAIKRTPVLLLAGLSVSAWFNFAAFETHALATFAIVLYLTALLRYIRDDSYSNANHILMILALLVCVWSRTDLWRLMAMTAALPILPIFQRLRARLWSDMALVAILGVTGTVLLSQIYFGIPLKQAILILAQRTDVSKISDTLMRPDNLLMLGETLKSFGFYSIYMPIDNGTYSVRYFLQPVVTMFSRPASAIAFSSGTALLFYMVYLALQKAIRGNLFIIAILIQWLVGWVFYTWFNPLEPFLWILEFLPLTIATLAYCIADKGRAVWTWVWVVAVLVGVHNWGAFYTVFR